MRFVSPAAGGLLLFLLAARPVSGQTEEPSPPSSSQGSALRPGDIVRLRIWREEDLSGEFQINNRGIVVFPRLGDYDVNDETAEHLVGRLVEDYRRYLVNPSIEVTVLRRVSILGAVTKPAIYNVDPTITIADALALAGGVTPLGNGDKIEILRDGEQITDAVNLRTRIGDSPLRSGDQIFVPERSIFQQNTVLFSTIISAAVTIGVALFLR